MFGSKRQRRALAFVAGATLVIAWIKDAGGIRHRIGHGAHGIGRKVRYVAHALPGIRYRLMGRHPDEHVSDDILADRIRSSIGGIEKSLDIPRVNVMVHDGVAVLHGAIGSPHERAQLERAVLNVAGVRGVESRVHIGFAPGDTRPSRGRAS